MTVVLLSAKRAREREIQTDRQRERAIKKVRERETKKASLYSQIKFARCSIIRALLNERIEQSICSGYCQHTSLLEEQGEIIKIETEKERRIQKERLTERERE